MERAGGFREEAAFQQASGVPRMGKGVKTQPQGTAFAGARSCEYATLICLSASIIYSITYVQFLPYGPYRDQAIAATAFSCIASGPWMQPS